MTEDFVGDLYTPLDDVDLDSVGDEKAAPVGKCMLECTTVTIKDAKKGEGRKTVHLRFKNVELPECSPVFDYPSVPDSVVMSREDLIKAVQAAKRIFHAMGVYEDGQSGFHWQKLIGVQYQANLDVEPYQGVPRNRIKWPNY